MLDLTRYVAGPYCTKLLALYGATVIKVERPHIGDPIRHLPPFVGDIPGPDRSLAFLDLNINKLSITLDLASDTGRQIFFTLLQQSDVVVENFRPGTMARFGLSYEELKRAKHDVVLISISNFGQSGPYRDLPASELALYAMGHEMYGTGQPDAPPLGIAPRVSLYLAGQTAAVAAMAAILNRRVRGRGEWVDVSIMECFASSIDRRASSLVAYAYTGEKMVRTKTVLGIEIPPSYNLCKDGYFHITVGSATWWDAFVEALGEPWLREARFRPPVRDPAIREEFDAFWFPWCLARTKMEIVQRFQEAGIPCAPVNSVADLLADVHLKVRGYFRALHHPVSGDAFYAGLPFIMHATPGEIRRAAPMLGADNAAVYGALGYSERELAQLAGAGVI